MTEKELFVSAFMQAEQILNAPYLENSDFGFEFSDKFESKMQSLISKERRIKFSTRRKISKSLLAAVIAAVIMLTGTLSVSASRRKLIDFVETLTPGFLSIDIAKDSQPGNEIIKNEYTLKDVPDGFKIVQYDKNDYGVFCVWKNESGEKIVFSQDPISTSVSMDNEHIFERTLVNGNNAYFHGEDGNLFITWNDGTYWFSIAATSTDKETLLDYAKNIIEKM